MPNHSVDRRTFLSLTAAAAGSVVVPEGLTAAPRARGGREAVPAPQEAPAPPLGNGEHPAFAFQAYPGGTGALYARWHREGVDPFARHPIPVAPWTGRVPRDEREIAYLPVHRLSALIRDGHLTSEELTRIYLDRLKRYDPVLLCAVTILEDRALEEARLGACPSKGVGRARGAFACSVEERRRVVAALRRGEATMDQPRTHHVPIHLQDHETEDCGLGVERPRLRRWRSWT